MSSFPIHDLSSAPAAARPMLEAAKQKFGFVPNLLGEFAEAPPALQAYLSLADAFSKTSLSPVEQQVVLLATSVTNACSYCVAAHTMMLHMAGLGADQVDRIRAGQALDDARLEALRVLVVSIVESRGWPSAAVRDAFTGAGYSAAQYLEVLTGVTQKTLSNYLNHVAGTPLDEPFRKFAWESKG